VIIGASTLVGDCDGDVVHSFPSGLTSATLLGCALVRLVACFCFVRTGGTGSITLDSTLSRCMKWSRLALVGCLERMDGRSERFGQLSGFAGIENPTTPRAIATYATNEPQCLLAVRNFVYYSHGRMRSRGSSAPL
jgi:hypothetical protein